MNLDPADLRIFSGCYLCEYEGRQAVGVCRCGAFVCRMHAVRLIHAPRRSPIGVVARGDEEQKPQLELVCETCYLNAQFTQERIA